MSYRSSVWLVWWGLAVQLVLFSQEGLGANNTDRCKLVSDKPGERKILSMLEPLTGKNYTVQDKHDKDDYTYTFQVCGDAGGSKGAGLIQTNQKDGKITVIGMYTMTKVIGGSDWVMLRYENGTQYSGHCSKTNRNAIIMISCDRSVDAGNLAVVLEERERSEDCFYLFEIDSKAVCPPLKSQLSAGSIILIIGVVLLAVYLIGGFLYQRLIVGAKGMEQFPNYAFWVEFGNLAADGCDFVCRTKGNREEPPTYRGVPSSEPVEAEPEERDDHLLPI